MSQLPDDLSILHFEIFRMLKNYNSNKKIQPRFGQGYHLLIFNLENAKCSNQKSQVCIQGTSLKEIYNFKF